MAEKEVSETITFSLNNKQDTEQIAREAEMKQTLETVYRSLSVKGYNPVNQIVWYILTEDPTYITNYNNARSLIRKIDRDELLNVLVRNYLGLSD
ncbi:MAG: IreB family regulatory phosphoprotein [Eubacteriales bacterium]|nr:IreB family regulatory phosphoprotein [Eubacteriales bacterium]